ncbi:MAG TPA: hypothetical protein VEA36_03000, partial [Candidatus Paceibacterota bacterium]|nr:hypothetical protein [Candidatus Paceibacterota bacterium]
IEFAPDAFGHGGDAFIAAFGEYTGVTTGPDIQLEGFGILRVDIDTKATEMFAANDLPGPSYINQTGGFNRPSDIVFAPDGSLYIVDWGGARITEEGLEETPETGIIWRIYKKDMHQPLRPDGPIVVPPAPTTDAEREPLVRNASELFGAIGRAFWQIAAAVALLILAIWFFRRTHNR